MNFFFDHDVPDDLIYVLAELGHRVVRLREAYAVSQRTREIGIRIAIGATARDVARTAIGRALRLTVIGVVVGLAVSQALSRLIESQFFGVRAWDPLTLSSVMALMIALAAVAAYFPARRAGRADPVAALKS